jgi:hypothetical protein
VKGGVKERDYAAARGFHARDRPDHFRRCPTRVRKSSQKIFVYIATEQYDIGA